MKPHAFTNGDILPYHMIVLDHIKAIVKDLPDGPTCHYVCERIIANENAYTKGLRHCKGKFNHFDHSWLRFKDWRIIIDPYPWACGSGPIMVLDVLPWSVLYVEDNHL